jgi:hypothetical protein
LVVETAIRNGWRKSADGADRRSRTKQNTLP